MLFPIDNGLLDDDGCRMRVFELTFEVPAIEEDVEDNVADELDAVIATHFDVTTATCFVEARDCLTAAHHAIETLRRLGAPAARLVDDLVTRGQIAERAGVTRQAVGQWIRGERHIAVDFPKPFVLAGGGLWLWGEVVDALAARGIKLDNDVAYPSRSDTQAIGGLLASCDAGKTAGWRTINTPGVFAVTRGTARPPILVPAVTPARSDFDYAA